MIEKEAWVVEHDFDMQKQDFLEPYLGVCI